MKNQADHKEYPKLCITEDTYYYAYFLVKHINQPLQKAPHLFMDIRRSLSTIYIWYTCDY